MSDYPLQQNDIWQDSDGVHVRIIPLNEPFRLEVLNMDFVYEAEFIGYTGNPRYYTAIGCSSRSGRVQRLIHREQTNTNEIL